MKELDLTSAVTARTANSNSTYATDCLAAKSLLSLVTHQYCSATSSAKNDRITHFMLDMYGLETPMRFEASSGECTININLLDAHYSHVGGRADSRG